MCNSLHDQVTLEKTRQGPGDDDCGVKRDSRAVMVRVHVVRAKCLKRTQVYPKYEHEAPESDHTYKETLEANIRLT